MCRDTLTPAHFHSCAKTRRTTVTQRHDWLVRAWARAAHSAGLTARVEDPQRDESGERTQPDCTIDIPGKITRIDVTVLRIEAPSYAGRKIDTLLAAREKEKINKYKEKCAREGCELMPVAVEAHGRLGRCARKLLWRLDEEHRANALFPNPSFRVDLMRDLAVALQRYNAHIDRRTIASLPREFQHTATNGALHPCRTPRYRPRRRPLPRLCHGVRPHVPLHMVT